jgi:hypothetical protein
MTNCKTDRWQVPGEVFSSLRRLMAWLAATVILSSFTWASDTGNDQKGKVPSVDAGRGPCTVDFRVTDSQQKPIANAWVYVEIRHGFLGLRKIELQVPTDARGRARVTGLSYETRSHPLEFRIQHGDDYRIIYHYPAGDCDARMIVTLPKAQPRPSPATGPENGQ